MKKNVIIAFIILSPFFLYSQNFLSRADFGIYSSFEHTYPEISYNSYGESSLISPKNTISPAIGVFTEFSLGKRFAFITGTSFGLLVTSFDAKIVDSLKQDYIVNDNLNIKNSIPYIKVPLIFRYYPLIRDNYSIGINMAFNFRIPFTTFIRRTYIYKQYIHSNNERHVFHLNYYEEPYMLTDMGLGLSYKHDLKSDKNIAISFNYYLPTIIYEIEAYSDNFKNYYSFHTSLTLGITYTFLSLRKDHE